MTAHPDTPDRSRWAESDVREAKDKLPSLIADPQRWGDGINGDEPDPTLDRYAQAGDWIAYGLRADTKAARYFAKVALEQVMRATEDALREYGQKVPFDAPNVVEDAQWAEDFDRLAAYALRLIRERRKVPQTLPAVQPPKAPAYQQEKAA